MAVKPSRVIPRRKTAARGTEITSIIATKPGYCNLPFFKDESSRSQIRISIWLSHKAPQRSVDGREGGPRAVPTRTWTKKWQRFCSNFSLDRACNEPFRFHRTPLRISLRRLLRSSVMQRSDSPLFTEGAEPTGNRGPEANDPGNETKIERYELFARKASRPRCPPGRAGNRLI